MNGLDVRALGWVVTLDVCGDVVRSFLGRPTRLPRGDLLALRECWVALRSVVKTHEYESRTVWLGGPRAITLSEKSETAVGDCVERLSLSCPVLYGERALLTRCLTQVVQVLAFGAVGMLLADRASAGHPSLGEAAIIAFALACLSLVTASHLFRTYLLVKRIGRAV